jgi:predicted DNA-binding transcriptional regulator YafY
MKKTERLLYILSLLRGNKRFRARDLANRCGVTERTIYRDVISISGSNIPIYFEDGYKVLSESAMPPSTFTNLEARFLISLLKSPHCSGKHYAQIAGRILDKIEASGVLELDMPLECAHKTLSFKILSRAN